MTINKQKLSLIELENIISEIKSGKSSIRLGRRSLNLLEEIVSNPQEIVIKSISQISSYYDVNASTITRLVRKLGFSGFKEFQLIIRQNLIEQKYLYSQRVSEILHENENNAETSEYSVFEQESLNLKSTLENQNLYLIKQVAKKIVDARKVHILALRGCYGAAHYFNYYLSFLREDSVQLGSSGIILAEELSTIHKDDVFICIALPPETKLTIDAARLAKKLGAKVIGISDPNSSNLPDLCEYHFTAHSKGSYFFNTSAALFTIIETLLLEICNKKGIDAIELIKKKESMFTTMGIEGSSI